MRFLSSETSMVNANGTVVLYRLLSRQVNRHQPAEHRDVAHVAKARSLEEANDTTRAGVPANRHRNVSIRIGVAVKQQSQRRPDDREVRQIDRTQPRTLGPIEIQ